MAVSLRGGVGVCFGVCFGVSFGDGVFGGTLRCFRAAIFTGSGVGGFLMSSAVIFALTGFPRASLLRAFLDLRQGNTLSFSIEVAPEEWTNSYHKLRSGGLPGLLEFAPADHYTLGCKDEGSNPTLLALAKMISSQLDSDQDEDEAPRSGQLSVR